MIKAAPTDRRGARGRTAWTIAAKSSLSSTTCAASRAASEPEFIATPTSAFLSAGASFIPSPVTPTRWWAAWAACTRAETGTVVGRLGRDGQRHAP